MPATFSSRSSDSVMLIFLSLIALAVVAVSSWSLWQSWRHEVQDVERQARNQSVSLARQAEDTFLQVQLTLDEVANHMADIATNPAAWSGNHGFLAQQQRQLPQLHGLYIYDTVGNRVAASSEPPPKPINNADRDYFIWHQHHSDTRLRIGQIMRSRTTGELVIPVSAGLRNPEGRFKGVALATVKVDYFRQFYGYYEMGPTDTLGLTMADSTVLYVRPFPDSYINKNLSASPLFTQRLKAAPVGGGTWASALDGITRIFGYASLARYPLVVSAGYDKNRLLGAWWQSNLPVLLLNGVLLLAVCIFGVMVLRQLRASMRYQNQLLVLHDELTRSNHILQDLALIDGLTGLGNRRQFDIYLEQCVTRSAKTGVPVSLLLCDIDFFKLYNDTQGHVAGDQCLSAVGEILRYLPLRTSDRVARYGGEEFAIIMPGLPIEDAEEVAQQALAAVHHAALPHPATPLPNGQVTISAGVATVSGDSAQPERLKSLADEALYQAKHAGRNCIGSINGCGTKSLRPVLMTAH